MCNRKVRIVLTKLQLGAGHDDDFRREVYETPEQKLKTTIIKMGEVVSTILIELNFYA